MAPFVNSCHLSRACVLVGLFAILTWPSPGTRAATYGGGAGTVDDPFLIATAEEFALMGDNPADWDQHFLLVNDIDLSGYDQTNLRMIGRWVALGSMENQPFRGFFDGNGKTISGFRYRDAQQEYVGLFQHVTGDVKNLRLLRPVVIGDGLGAGALVGYLEKGGVVDCAAVGVDVSGDYAVGGLVGAADGSVLNCWSQGRVSGVRYVGGLVGQVGGGQVARSYSRADVMGNESVGGLIGVTLKETAIVDSCYALGAVQGSSYVGGLVGQVVAGRVFRCYAAGRVSGPQWTGGLVGYQRTLAQVITCLWDIEASTQATSVGGMGRTTAELKSIDTYLSLNWDFSTTWAICEGRNYPVFIWQIPVGDLRCPDGVDFIDFVWFANNWRHNDCREWNYLCDGADLDGSGAVEFRDLALFAANWLAGLE